MILSFVKLSAYVSAWKSCSRVERSLKRLDSLRKAGDVVGESHVGEYAFLEASDDFLSKAQMIKVLFPRRNSEMVKCPTGYERVQPRGSTDYRSMISNICG